ncbi:MAG TPA: DUF5691 domain-containing protein [Mucilaginibacter sp.]|jgi:hypothetical protein|nr:DUF5691 domain-containing protein [Mucilaginibacter sp.]
MSAWEYILNTAMLGTDKRGAAKPDFPGELAEVIELIENTPENDKETRFLNTAAIAFNYRQCGFVPIKKPEISATAALPETSPYSNERASAVLRTILEENNAALLETWLSQCDQHKQTAIPALLPELLDKAAQNAALQPAVVNCCGNRGAWLSQFNSAWGYFKQATDEEIWQTGKPEDRAKVLRSLRQIEPGKAREWLQQTWDQENAAAKAELLKCLNVNAGPEDLPWLETLPAEKGQKVKDETMALLKKIPGSSVILQYEALLRQSVTLKKEKALLGMMNKTSIQIKVPDAIDEGVVKSGIEKLAGTKSPFTDEHFIAYQLMSAVPPTFWEKQFDASPQQVVDLFEKNAPAMVSALGMAVSVFNEKAWMPYFLQQDGFYPDFINMLPAREQEKYLIRIFHQAPKDSIHYALQCNFEWGREFSLFAIRFMADQPYEYNATFFSKHVNLIPVSVLGDLEKISPKNASLENAWGRITTHLLKLLNLKQQIIQAFNA